jgi:hypothetical protein
MNQTGGSIRPVRRWRRFTRFGLRTLFALTTLVGVALWGCQRYWESRLPIRELPGGVKLRGFGGMVAGTSWRPTWLGESVPFKAWDQHGRLLCQGLYVNGRATGIWSCYHPNGRVALRGKCRSGVRTGTWTAWDEQGHKRAEIEHGTPVSLPQGSAFAAAPRRSGTAQQWWPDGQRRSAGEFQDDLPHGRWTYWQGATPIETEYVMGRPVTSVAEFFAECERGLQSGEWRHRRDAVAALATAGSVAQPLWIKALQSPHVDVQLFALEWLRRAGPAARTALPDIQRLSSSTDPSTAVEALITGFTIDEDRRSAWFAQLAELLKARLNPQNMHLLSRIVQLVGEPTVPFLESSLDAADADRRLLAVLILGEMFRSTGASPPGVAAPDLRQRLEDSLQKAAKSRDPGVAAHAQRVLDKYAVPNTPGGMGGGFF